jgi:hypothetical protein
VCACVCAHSSSTWAACTTHGCRGPQRAAEGSMHCAIVLGGMRGRHVQTRGSPLFCDSAAVQGRQVESNNKRLRCAKCHVELGIRAVPSSQSIAPLACRQPPSLPSLDHSPYCWPALRLLPSLCLALFFLLNHRICIASRSTIQLHHFASRTAVPPHIPVACPPAAFACPPNRSTQQ